MSRLTRTAGTCIIIYLGFLITTAKLLKMHTGSDELVLLFSLTYGWFVGGFCVSRCRRAHFCDLVELRFLQKMGARKIGWTKKELEREIDEALKEVDDELRRKKRR